MRGLFVTATDTGVGKTIVSAALLAAMAADGQSVRAYKPVITGLEDPTEIAARGIWPADDQLLGSVTGMDPEEVAPLRYGPAVSPHLAAQLAGAPIDPVALFAYARDRAQLQTAGTLIVEGVGGLLTPLAENYTVCDLAQALDLPMLIAARPGLGTINHTLLTLQAARAASLDVRAIVLTPWPEKPTKMQISNRETVKAMGQIEVETLGPISGPTSANFAQIGTPLARSLGLLSPRH